MLSVARSYGIIQCKQHLYLSIIFNSSNRHKLETPTNLYEKNICVTFPLGESQRDYLCFFRLFSQFIPTRRTRIDGKRHFYFISNIKREIYMEFFTKWANNVSFRYSRDFNI